MKNNKEVVEFLKKVDENGDAEFQYIVGRCYSNGHHIEITNDMEQNYGIESSCIIEKNHDEAIKWYTLSAVQGHAGAQFLLGRTLDPSLTFIDYADKDSEKAVKWYKLSSEQGHPRAQNNLAMCYENGNGVTQSYSEAIKLYSLSSEQGFWYASQNLGRLYSRGVGVEFDLEKAKKYYEKANRDVDFPLCSASVIQRRHIELKLRHVETKLFEHKAKLQAASNAARTGVFVSYSHKDSDFKNELKPYLDMLENTSNAKITWWDDEKIKPGEKWEQEIEKSLQKSKVAILLASENFFASKYIWRKEFPEILEAANKDGATILWIPLSNCPYELTGICSFQSVVDNLNRPLEICESHERKKVYSKVVRRINELFKTP